MSVQNYEWNRNYIHEERRRKKRGKERKGKEQGKVEVARDEHNTGQRTDRREMIQVFFT